MYQAATFVSSSDETRHLDILSPDTARAPTVKNSTITNATSNNARPQKPACALVHASKRRVPASVSLTQLQRLHTRELTDETVEQLVVPYFERQIARNAHTRPPPSDDNALPFYCVTVPSIGIRAYVRTALKHAGCSRGAFIAAAVLLKRAAQANTSLELCARNVHRLFIAALLLAAKSMDDRVRMNGHYARVAGIPHKSELANLEWRLLQAVDFRVLVTREEYSDCVLRLALHKNLEGYDDAHMCAPTTADCFGGALEIAPDCPTDNVSDAPIVDFIIRATPAAIQESERRAAKRAMADVSPSTITIDEEPDYRKPVSVMPYGSFCTIIAWLSCALGWERSSLHVISLKCYTLSVFSAFSN